MEENSTLRDPGIRTVEIQDAAGAYEYFEEICRTGRWELLVTNVEMVGAANKRLLVTFYPIAEA